MTVLHAFNRKKDHNVSFNGGVLLKFTPNALGDVICDVTDDSLAAILLAIPTAYRAYAVSEPVRLAEPVISSVLATVPGGNVATPASTTAEEQAAAAAYAARAAALLVARTLAKKAAADRAAQPPAEPSPYVLVGPDGTSFDLRPLDDAALRAFADANGIKVHHAAKGDTIRDKIVEAFKKPV